MNGWWKFHRGYWDILSRLSHAQLAVAVYVFNSANNKDRDWFDGLSRITIKKGSFVDSQLKIAEACKTTRQVVRDCLSQLQQNGLISIGWFDSKKNQVRTNRSTNEGTKRYSLITVIESPTFPGYIYDKEPSEEPSLPLKENQVRTTTEEGKKEKKGRSLPRPLALPESVPWGNSCCLILKYNREAPDNVPSVRSLSEARIDRERRFLRMFPDEAWWTMTFRQYYRSKFLRGHKEPENGHKSFQPDFDWLLSKGKDGIENCVKVHDGRYCDD